MSLLSELWRILLFHSHTETSRTAANCSQVHIPQKKADGKGKGFAFLQYGEPEHAVEAFSQNDGTIFQGRLLHIIPATSKRETMDDYEISKLPLKKQREVRRKMEAGKATFNWNSLYLNVCVIAIPLMVRY